MPTFFEQASLPTCPVALPGGALVAEAASARGIASDGRSACARGPRSAIGANASLDVAGAWRSTPVAPAPEPRAAAACDALRLARPSRLPTATLPRTPPLS
jgi:hypothetical protein